MNADLSRKARREFWQKPRPHKSLQPPHAIRMYEGMHTEFSVFRERLADACRVRNMTHSALCRSIGLGARKAIDLEYSPLKSLDLHRVTQIADHLDVSIDWLLGRSNVMNAVEMQDLPEPTKRKAKRSG